MSDQIREEYSRLCNTEAAKREAWVNLLSRPAERTRESVSKEYEDAAKERKRFHKKHIVCGGDG